MKNCIKEANKQFISDIKKRINKANMIIAGAILFFVVEFITIAEILNAYIPYPSSLVGITIGILIVLFLAVQVVYAFYVYDTCMDKDKDKS